MSVDQLSRAQRVERMAALNTKIETLRGYKKLTSIQETDFESIRAEFESLDSVNRSEDLQRVRADLRRGVESGRYRVEGGPSSSDDYDRDAMREPQSIESKRYDNPWDLSQVRTFGKSPDQAAAELRARALSAVEQMASCSDKIRAAATSIIERFDDNTSSISRQALATSSPEYLRAFVKMARGHQHLLTAHESRALDLTRAMSLTNTAGGFLAPFQLDPTVIITSAGSRNDIRQAARQVVATGSKWHGASSGAVQWSWDGEAVEVSDDSTTFAQPTVTLYKGAGFVPISLEALEDEQNVAQEVGRLLAQGKDDLEAPAFISGNGTTQPHGLVAALTATKMNAAVDDTFSIGDIYSVQGALPARHRVRASWLANGQIYNKVRQFDVYGGAGFWTNLNADRPPLLLGKPALEAEAMDGTITTAGANSNLILAFGDFSNYVIADKLGMTIEFIPHLFDTASNRPSGSRGWYAHYRVGAEVVNVDAFRLLDVVSAA